MPSEPIAVETVVAKKVELKGRNLSLYGYLHLRHLPNGEVQFFMVPSADWKEMYFSSDELNLLGIRLSFPSDGLMPLPDSCDGDYVVAYGQLRLNGSKAFLHMTDTSGVRSRTSREQFDCRSRYTDQEHVNE